MTESAERWLPAPFGYGELYEVSNKGQVRRVQKPLKPQINTHGYPAVGLCRDGISKTYAIHTLVLTAFAGEPPAGQEACHSPDGDGKTDNRWPEALRWGTKPENQADRIPAGTSNRGERSANAKLTKEKIMDIRRRYAAGESQRALSLEYDVSNSLVSNIISGKVWAHVPGADPARDGRTRMGHRADFRAKMSEAGHKGAAARWHPSQVVDELE